MTLIILTNRIISWQAKPARLHCSHCDDTYALPQNGTVRIYRELKCPLDDFELLSWSSGHRGKSYPLCPYCYNYPPFRYGILVQLLPSRVYLVISSDLKSKPAPDLCSSILCLYCWYFMISYYFLFHCHCVLGDYVSSTRFMSTYNFMISYNFYYYSSIPKLLFSGSVKWC